MTEIQQFRVEILEEATRRMKYQDYGDLNYADIDELVFLCKARYKWEKELRPPKWILKDRHCTELEAEENREIKEENQRIKETYIKPLEFKIKVLELEIMLFDGMFEMIEISENICKRVHPNGEQ